MCINAIQFPPNDRHCQSALGPNRVGGGSFAEFAYLHWGRHIRVRVYSVPAQILSYQDAYRLPPHPRYPYSSNRVGTDRMRNRPRNWKRYLTMQWMKCWKYILCQIREWQTAAPTWPDPCWKIFQSSGLRMIRHGQLVYGRPAGLLSLCNSLEKSTLFHASLPITAA